MTKCDRWSSGQSVMVLGTITFSQKSALMYIGGTLNLIDYIHNILDPMAIPLGLAAVGQDVLFQDDNTQPHRTRIIDEYNNRHWDYTDME